MQNLLAQLSMHDPSQVVTSVDVEAAYAADVATASAKQKPYLAFAKQGLLAYLTSEDEAMLVLARQDLLHASWA